MPLVNGYYCKTSHLVVTLWTDWFSRGVEVFPPKRKLKTNLRKIQKFIKITFQNCPKLSQSKEKHVIESELCEKTNMWHTCMQYQFCAFLSLDLVATQWEKMFKSCQKLCFWDNQRWGHGRFRLFNPSVKKFCHILLELLLLDFVSFILKRWARKLKQRAGHEVNGNRPGFKSCAQICNLWMWLEKGLPAVM